jgi:hypothetical protein
MCNLPFYFKSGSVDFYMCNYAECWVYYIANAEPPTHRCKRGGDGKSVI